MRDYARSLKILLLIVVAVSFDPTDAFRFPPPGVSLRWYVAFFTNDTFMRAFFRVSLVIAVLGGLSLAEAELLGDHRARDRAEDDRDRPGREPVEDVPIEADAARQHLVGLRVPRAPHRQRPATATTHKRHHPSLPSAPASARHCMATASIATGNA